MKRAINIVATAASMILLALALWDQLVRDPEHRTRHGQVFGVPYDFRRPTLSKIKERFWDPQDSRLLTPHVFGVGWSVNVGRLAALVRGII
ncbi:MAG: DUF5808 domain-containing protein [Thermomicrobiales bacterium]